MLLLALSCDPESSSSGSATPPKVWHVSTVAGNLLNPFSIAQIGDMLYVASNGANIIFTIDKNTAEVSRIGRQSFVGLHANGGVTTARFNSPRSIVAVASNTLYVADGLNNRIRAVDIASGAVSDLAGSGTSGRTNGTGTAVQFSYPTGMFVNGNTLYIADFSNSLVRKI